MSKATASPHERREENLQHLLGYCPVRVEECVPKRDKDGVLLRYAAVEWHENGSYWIALFDDIKGCLGYFFSTEGGWMPYVIFDLQTTATYKVNTHCTIGSMTNL